MKPRIEVKFNCDGLCGKFQTIPWNVVEAALKKSEDITQYGWTCEPCKAWFNKRTCQLLLKGKP